MQSYYQYFIALVSACFIILSSENHNSVNFCSSLTNYVWKSKLRTCLTIDTNFADWSDLRTKFFEYKLVYFFGTLGGIFVKSDIKLFIGNLSLKFVENGTFSFQPRERAWA